jgi:hypothetical protein
MALVIKDRVYETSTTTGTGTLTLAGAVLGFQTFSTAIGNTNTTYYVIQDQSGPNWEVGIGTVGAGTLSRDTVLSSSNSGSLVNFTSGLLYAFGDYPADKAVYGSGTTLVAPSGTLLPVANGGTGLTTLTANNVILGNGTSTPAFVAPGTLGNVLTSNGTTWTSAAAGGGSSTITIDTKTASYTVIAGDAGKIINCSLLNPSAAITISLTAAATLGAGFNCVIWNAANVNTYTVTIDPSGSETIDGNTTLVLRSGEGTQIICDGTKWYTGNKKTMRFYAENSSAQGSYSPPIAIGSKAIALGSSYASGTESFAAAITNNTSSYGATGANSIAMGRLAKANSDSGIAIGNGSTATGQYSTAINYQASASNTTSIAIGFQASCSGSDGVAIGRAADASGTKSVAIGRGAYSTGEGSVTINSASDSYSATADKTNAFAFGAGAYASSRGKFAFSPTDRIDSSSFAQGNQHGLYVLTGQTTNATAYVLVSDGGANGSPYSENQVALQPDSAYSFTGTIVARRSATGGTASAAWKIEGLIRKEGTDPSTTLVASTVTAISNVPGWAIALSADTSNGALTITATGAAATDIRWVANVQTSEVIYA